MMAGMNLISDATAPIILVRDALLAHSPVERNR